MDLKRLLTESVGYCLNFLTLDVPPQRRSGSGVREAFPGGGCGGMSGGGGGGRGKCGTVHNVLVSVAQFIMY